MTFSLDSLLSALHSLLPSAEKDQQLLVALSGGLDSVVLLHGLSVLRQQGKLKNEIAAVHINHGLQKEADSWQSFCMNLCNKLDVPISCHSVDLNIPETDSSSEKTGMEKRGAEKGTVKRGIENAARIARYEVFDGLMGPSTVLLQAHHRDDQMETLLLRLMRGAGALGLSGIPASRALGMGCLVRPMLQFDRAELLSYAQENDLEWVEDVSNTDQNFDRNYCRHTLLPMVEERWPSYRESWSKTVALESESLALQQALAEIDLNSCLNENATGLKVDEVMKLDDPRRRNLLRFWLSTLGLPDLGWNRLRQLSLEVLAAAEDTARLEGEGYALLRFRGSLFAVRNDSLTTAVDQDLQWRLSEPQEFSLQGNGRLISALETGLGLSAEKSVTLNIRYRQGGESCRLSGRPRKLLKKILYEHHVEPWLRSRIPLLFCGDELVCIPGIGVAEGYQAEEGEKGWRVEWEKPRLLVTGLS